MASATHGEEGEAAAVDGLEAGDLTIEFPRLFADRALEAEFRAELLPHLRRNRPQSYGDLHPKTNHKVARLKLRIARFL